MPRLIPRGSGDGGGDETITVPPRRIETTLLALEQFRDPAGTTWLSGDRVPLHSRAVRQAVFERPDLFVMEFESAPVDLDWIRELDDRYEAELEQVKLRRAEREVVREEALHAEMADDKAADRESDKLERRYAKQEAEREREGKERREREVLEADLAATPLRSGFNVD